MLYSKVYIDAFGYELPPNVVTSEDLELRLEPLYKKLHFQKGQLEAITGIRERRFWDPGFKMHAGAVLAGKKALEDANITTDDVGMLIYGGVCRDNLEPATACAVCDGLGLRPETQIYDVSNACLGILNGMVQVANRAAPENRKHGSVQKNDCNADRWFRGYRGRLDRWFSFRRRPPHPGRGCQKRHGVSQAVCMGTRYRYTGQRAAHHGNRLRRSFKKRRGIGD